MFDTNLPVRGRGNLLLPAFLGVKPTKPNILNLHGAAAAAASQS